MSSRKAASKQISYKDESSSEEDSDLEKVDKKVVKKGRKSQKKQKKAEEDESSGSEFELEKEKPKGKKGKGKGKRGGGKEGKGKEKEIKKNPFDVLPFELFTEILSHLSPKDLLHLARTSKSYRSILLSKQRSETLWKQSLESVGLPLLRANDWSLPAYAHLVFHLNCFECDKKAPAWIDPWLRTRLCKACRQVRVVKLSESLVKSQEYHSLIRDCLGGSHYTASDTRYLCVGREYYVLSSAIEAMNEKLLELQEEDTLDVSSPTTPYEQQGSQKGYAWIKVVPTAQRRKKRNSIDTEDSTPQRSTRAQVHNQNYYEADSEEDEGRLELGPRVENFLIERKDLNRKIHLDAIALCNVASMVVELVKAEDELNTKRLKLEKRLNTLDGYEASDLDYIRPNALAEFLEGDALSDADWKRLKPGLLHLIDAAKAKERLKDLEARLFSAESERKNSLRRYYNKVLEETQEGRFPPLFVDFLVLPSVQLLWKRKNDQDFRQIVTGLDWIMKRDSVIDDLQEYHLDLVDKAVGLIISTTREYSDEDEFETLVEEVLAGDLDLFFSQATSMVFCDDGRCMVETYRSRRSWNRRGKLKSRNTSAYFDSFPEVLAHQLSDHNDYEAPLQPTRSQKRYLEPGFKFTLPSEVACVVKELVRLVKERPKEELVEEEAANGDVITRYHLYDLDEGSFSWETTVVKENYFESWKDLVKQVFMVACKASRSRPPVMLEPPKIVWYPRMPTPSIDSYWFDTPEATPSPQVDGEGKSDSLANEEVPDVPNEIKDDQGDQKGESEDGSPKDEVDEVETRDEPDSA